jgi:hypothetical protein
MKILVVSSGFSAMLCALSQHFVFVCVVIFTLGIVFWASSIFGFDFLVLWNFYLTVSCSRIILVLLRGT